MKTTKKNQEGFRFDFSIDCRLLDETESIETSSKYVSDQVSPIGHPESRISALGQAVPLKNFCPLIEEDFKCMQTFLEHLNHNLY
jgi:hypothetical protein